MTALRNLIARHTATALLIAAVGGCSHEVQSPAPHVMSATPQVICTEQLTTTIAITGDHFTPLPIRILGGRDGGNQPQTLQLPAISLARVFTLDGMMLAAGGGPDGGTGDGGWSIHDDYDTPTTSHVAWASETSMAFDTYPELGLAIGVYDITVTNPDGTHTATLHNGLAAVPPPHVVNIDPPSICVAQMDQRVTINGTGFLRIDANGPTISVAPQGGGAPHTYMPTDYQGCTMVAQNVRQGLQECTGITFTIPQNDLPVGTYTVTITNPPTANCHSTESVTLVVAPPPDVTSVSPMTICQGGGTINVTGTAFQDGAHVTLGTTDATTVTFNSSTMVSATFSGASAMFTPGMMYDLTLVNPDGCRDTLRNAVTAVPGPVVFFADPPVVYNGITTQVTLYSTSITPPLVSVQISTAGGTPITLMAQVDPAHSHRILAQVPMGTPAGTYDITVTDSSGCPATLAMGLRVTDMNTLTLTSIDPPFGWQMSATAVTINAAGGLLATPRAYLNPHTPSATTIATALSSVSFVSATRLTAIVPPGLDPANNPYDLIVVNPDGTVGVLTMPDTALYRSTTNPPPTIDSISPVAVSIPVPAGTTITINGANFRMPMVTFTCRDTAGMMLTLPQTVGTSTATSIVINTPNFGALGAPGVCTIRVTNGDDMSYGDFSALAISNSSGNLSPSAAGPMLPDARRGAAALAADATRAAHYLYVVGGDNGMASGAFDTVFTIQTNETGYGAAWTTQRYHLNAARTLAGSASLGRYLYVVGGNSGTGPVNTVERAMVLDPLQSPQVTDIDIVPGMGAGTGLGGGQWYYRVAAVMATADPDNPDGETLPSDEFPILLPDLPSRLQVRLTWSPVPGAAAYIVYRTPTAGLVAGQEEFLAMVTGGSTTTYNDTGTATMMSMPTPLPLGSTGRWRTLATLNSARESNYAVFGVDPADPNAHYLYATFGRSMTAALNTYEFLPVTVNATTGQQTPAAAWTAGTGTLPTGARYQHYAYSATHENASFVPAGTNFIYVGGGTNDGTGALTGPSALIESARVQAGGQLSAWAAAGTAHIANFGAGSTIAANYIYTFGDEMPAASISAGQIDMSMPASIVNFNNNGNALTAPRYLPGTTLQGAYIYVIGGSTTGRMSASNTVEAMIW